MNTLALDRQSRPGTSTLRRVGLALSALVVLFFAADAIAELMAIQPVLHAAAEIGFPTNTGLWQGIGTVVLVATLLLAVPRTALFGAIVLTGYLGGAICSHVRLGDGFVAPTVTNVVIAVLMWAGLAMRDDRLRAMVTGR